MEILLTTKSKLKSRCLTVKPDEFAGYSWLPFDIIISVAFTMKEFPSYTEFHQKISKKGIEGE